MLPFDEYNHYAILSMAEADGKIWISTTDGFWVADQQTLEIRRLNITDKRFTSMFFDRTSGEFYLGTAVALPYLHRKLCWRNTPKSRLS